MTTVQAAEPQGAVPPTSNNGGRTKASSTSARRSWVSIGLVAVLIGMTLTGVMSYLFAYDARLCRKVGFWADLAPVASS